MEENRQDQLTETLQPQPVQEQNYYQSNPEENKIYSPPTTNTVITSNMQPVENTSNQKSNNNNCDTNSLWYDLSILSWFLFLCAGLTSYKEHLAPDNYQPVGAYLTLVIGLITTIGVIGFIIYFKNTTLNKNQTLLNGMLGEMSKYHSVCLFLVTLLLISFTNPKRKASYIFSLIFSILSYGSLFFIYLKTEFEAAWYEMLTIKKGIFSCLIAFTCYEMFYSIAAIGSWGKPVNDFVKGSGISFSILIGLGNLGFAFFFKDILVAIINLLIYIEMGKFFYDKKPNNINADGVIDIIMGIISAGVIFYLLLKERDSLYRS